MRAVLLSPCGIGVMLAVMILPAFAWSSERLERLDRLETKLNSMAAPEQSPLVRACDHEAVNSWHPDVRSGRITASGVDFDKIKAAAIGACRSATERFPGHARSLANLGRALAAAEDYSESLHISRQAADMGDVYAIFAVGLAYDYGEGVPEDDSEAVKWFRKAAEQGFGIAQNKLGYKYWKGDGVPDDNTEAVKWFRKAAEQGVSYGMNNLGWMYAHGEGLSRNPSRAAELYFKALEGGSDWVIERDHDEWDRDTARALQVLLRDAGLYDGTIDGAIGPGTEAAMRLLIERGS
ncbi:MAG: hypothetical protein ACQETX_14825 [Pseudomonadota bacterium]